jgi:hypothetical protein
MQWLRCYGVHQCSAYQRTVTHPFPFPFIFQIYCSSLELGASQFSGGVSSLYFCYEYVSIKACGYHLISTCTFSKAMCLGLKIIVFFLSVI